MQKSVLVAGSHGEIGKAVSRTLADKGYRVLSFSRHELSFADHLTVSMSEPDSVELMKDWLGSHVDTLVGVIHCAGVLHDGKNRPEKNLKQLNLEWLQTSIATNVMTHVHVAQALNGYIKPSSDLRWLSLSAKVGSIEDNGLEGWYSYRMSKAALNMFIKNLAIEWGRRSPQSSVMAMHPGTTPSALSEPFTGNWPQEKLYPPELTAARIVSVFEQMTPEGTGKLYHHDGSVIPW